VLPVILQSVILGLVQAVTEFLPISSSAHLILARAVLDFGVVDGLTFDVALHMGTLAAIVLYFWGDLRSLARGFLVSIAKRSGDADPASRLSWYVLAACIPAGLVGFTYETAIETYFRHPAVIVVTLILGAFLFLWVEKRFKHDGAMQSLTLGRAVAIGLAQTLSLVPGVSRSGITIVTGMMCGLRRDESARFSFLMTSPLLLGAGVKKSLDLFGSGEPITSVEIVALVVGVLTSAIAGWFVIRFLLNFLRSRGLQVFAYYRIVLAMVVLAFLVF
jgi:undecaprenyl-diphosphatase